MHKYNVPSEDRLGLIDGDILVYSCAFAAMKDNLQAAEAKLLMDEMILNIRSTLQLNDCRIFLTDGEGNFRNDVAVTAPYKGHRQQEKPEHYVLLRQYLIESWGAEVMTGMEADDGMGMAQTETSIIVTVDKDLNQITGWHYNWRKMDVYHVSKEDAIHYYYTQMLTGDAGDNIKGIYGIGPVKAKKLLDGLSHDRKAMRKVVVTKYKEHFGEKWKDRYRENSKLLMIKGGPLDA